MRDGVDRLASWRRSTGIDGTALVYPPNGRPIQCRRGSTSMEAIGQLSGPYARRRAVRYRRLFELCTACRAHRLEPSTDLYIRGTLHNR
jgi:hypothetical protein